MSIHTTNVTLLGDIRIELLISPDGFFRGLGAITVRGVPLRNAEVPLRIQMDTHDGILYTQLRLREIVPLADGGHELRLAALGLPWGVWRNHYI